PEEAARSFRLPEGFKATVFAAEPDVQNPIAMSWDSRGRLWIAENYTYAETPRRFELSLRDRIIILEDTNGDGHFDKRTVFADNLQMLTSIEVGRGGVWAMCPSQMLFIPDRNHDDKPDGEAEVVLDGFTVPQENYHNFANGLHFGPDGWLYGRVGATAPGEIGIPGAPPEKRVPVRGGAWRYHPERKTFEALTYGNTNPWGNDWNAAGEMFYVNTVNGHLWHAIPGAHFVRAHTLDPNPFAYSLIDLHADHWHFDTAQDWTKSRDGAADGYGGGHAHVGAMVYLGDNWPDEYRGHLFTLNQHGRRANQEILERTGSGYVAHHGKDMMFAADPWFRGIDLSYGPDGGVYVLDWSDTGECHDKTGVHRTSGRIYKVVYKDPKKLNPFDVSKMKSAEMVQLHSHKNEWFVRQARLELTQRSLAGERKEIAMRVRKAFDAETRSENKLRLFFTLFAVGGADEAFLAVQLKSPDENLRNHAVKLLLDEFPLDTVMGRSPRPLTDVQKTTWKSIQSSLVQLGKTDSSGLVHLALASSLQRIPVEDRPALGMELVQRAEEANDHNLPLMIWYGFSPVADSAPEKLISVALKCELPLTRKYISRRLGEQIESNPAAMDTLLKSSGAKSVEFQKDILRGLSEAMTGWRKAKKPQSWDALAAGMNKFSDVEVRTLVRELSVIFGDGRALDELKAIALDKNAEVNARKAALQTLIDGRSPDLQAVCEQLLSVQFLNPVAARGLAGMEDPAIAAKLVKSYSQFHQSERPQLLATLVSRPRFAFALLDAIAQKKIPRTDLSVFHVRQIRSLNDEKLNARLTEVWGELREPGQDKKQGMAELKARLTPATLASADKRNGRAVFTMACAPCHTFYGEGGKLGPDLTGSGRDNIDYLLENVIDPSAVVPADFRMTVIEMKDGRTLNGIIRTKTERTLTVQTMTEQITVEKTEIASQKESQASIMPEGLLEALTKEQVRDLMAYLMHKTQVAMPDAK
ncbi:MAG: Cytochrome c, partial [Verrucomicrobiales bacterium]|nr:Cytochrome c [Verrucomicrobiales bacterium]